MYLYITFYITFPANILADTDCECLNGGQCVKGADDNPACFCDSAYFGPACENERGTYS